MLRSRSLVVFLGRMLVARAEASEIHAAPAEDLETIDVGAINQAHHSVDMAAYVLTDGPVIDALRGAAERGVAVRIYLDGRRASARSRASDGAFGRLAATPGVTLRDKQPGTPLMHLKSYCVDGRMFRTGSANFTRIGLRRQDNDLMLFDDPALCAGFEGRFALMWSGADDGRPILAARPDP